MVRSTSRQSLAFPIFATLAVVAWRQASPLALVEATQASSSSFGELQSTDILSQERLVNRGRTGKPRIRGASASPVKEVEAPTRTDEATNPVINNRRLTTKGCVSKLSEDRGGAGGVSKCSTTESSDGGGGGSGGGPQIATQCDQVTSRHRLLGNGAVSAAHNFGGEILDPPCDRNYFGRGTWWNYVGTGERVVVSTCHQSTNISTALFLYRSSDLTCDTLECMARSNLNQCGFGGIDAFFASANVVYYISILGDNGNNRNIPGPEGSMAISFTRQANGCATTVPALDSSRGTVTSATIDGNSPMLGPQCSSNLHGRGLWYQFEGTGENVLISTCHSTTTIPTAISVYETEQATNACSGLTCQGFALTSEDCLDDATGKSKGSMVRLKAADGLSHYVSIVGDNESDNNVYPEGPQGDVGVNMIREFNGCDRDIAPSLLDDGSVVTSSNMQSRGAPLLGPQCEQNHNGRGRWYQFWGKGEPVLISTCHSSTTIPTMVSVYEAGGTGSVCQGSICQAFEDSNQCENGNGSVLLLSNTTKDKTHYLSVLGNNGNQLYPSGPEGEIGVSVVTRSNGCDQATPMFDDGRLNILDTADGPMLGPQCDMQYHGRGYWYTFLGEGREVIASTCHPQTNISTVISVYESSNGGCGKDLACVAMETTSGCESGGLGGAAKFLAKAGVIYKISVMGDNGNSLFPGPDGDIAFSIVTDVSCPCWSASELTTATPETIYGGYVAQSCNTIITADQSASIQLASTVGLGARMTRFDGTENSIGCSMTGQFGRTVDDLQFGDEIELCLSILYERCAELSNSGSVELADETGLDATFVEKCSPKNFYDTILLAEAGAEYGNCLNVTTPEPTSTPSASPSLSPSVFPTPAPSPSPSISCPCWTMAELESVTPASLDFTTNSCNTEITGDLSIPSDPVGRASIRVVDESGLGARIAHLGANDERTVCTMAGAETRSVISLSTDEVEACLILLYSRCEALSEAGAVNVAFSDQCSLLDFSDAIIASVDGSDYDNCLGLSD